MVADSGFVGFIEGLGCEGCEWDGDYAFEKILM
jgi:hypothetical protein